MSHICDNFEKVDGFHSPWHFEKFQASIEQMISCGLVKEISVKEGYSIVKYEERWIQCPNGDIWRMVTPDFPFPGLFEKVAQNRDEKL